MKKFLKFELWMMLLGFVVGIGLFYIVPWVQWEFISKVPGTPTQLIYDEADYSGSYSFYVKTSDDLLYLCEPNAKGKSCIQIDTNTSLPDNSPSCGESTSMFTPPPVPGILTASLVVRDCIRDGYIDIQVVGLDDGSIWTWEAIDTIFAPIVPFCLGGICALIAMILGAFFYGIRAQRRDDSPSKAKNDAKRS